MKLISLKLRNFQGAVEVDFVPNGENATISGQNAAGKTTIVNAENWLLWGKDSLGNSDSSFEIKPKTPEGDVIHFLESSVEGVFELENGKQITLKKIYKENWQRAVGETDKSFKGNTTDYYVNGVSQLKKQYDEEIANIGTAQAFRELSDPMYMAGVMPWKDLRTRLFERFGDISDAEVILATPELHDVVQGGETILGLASVMGDTPLEKFRAGLASKKTQINKDLNDIPIKIRTIDDGMKTPLPEAVPGDLESKKAELTKFQEQKASASVGGLVGEKQNELRAVELEIQQIETRLRNEANQGPQEAAQKRSLKQAEINSVSSHIATKESQITTAKGIIETLDASMATSREEFAKISAEEFAFVGDENCPACGQSLPEDKVADARQRALENFNLAKSKRLTENNENGGRLKSRKDTIEAGVTKAESEKAPLVEQLAKLEDELSSLPLSNTTASVNFNEDESHNQATKRKLELEGEIAKLKESSLDAIGAIEESIQRVQTQITAMQTRAVAMTHREAEQKRKEAMANEQKVLAKEFEELDRQFHMTDVFIRAKSAMLTDQINSKFQMAKFKLFNELVNGGTEECCVVMVEGVEYISLNHGKKVNVGLDIINVMGEVAGFRPPIFVDFAESVTWWLPVKAQLIKLKAVEGLKDLQFSISGDTAVRDV